MTRAGSILGQMDRMREASDDEMPAWRKREKARRRKIAAITVGAAIAGGAARYGIRRAARHYLGMN